jgi:co-chaperonin GroES (HSP10)
MTVANPTPDLDFEVEKPPKPPKNYFLVPMPDLLVVEEDAWAYGGSLHIPEKYRRRGTTGKVVAVGDNISEEWLGLRVFWARLNGIPAQFKNKPVLIFLRSNEILAVLKEEAKLEEEVPASMMGE